MGPPYAGKTRPAGYATTPGPIPTGPEPFRQLSKLSASGHLKGTVPKYSMRAQADTVPLETVNLYFLELAWIVMGVR